MTQTLDARLSRPRDGGPSFPLRHRLFRAVWRVTWLLLAAWTPPPLRAWRRLLLRVFGADLHRTAVVYGSARVWYPPNLVMAERACLGPGVDCYCMDKITLGAGALVSQDAYLCGGTHDLTDEHFQLIARPISIGPDAWIAAGAMVGPGVSVGAGAVLGARSVAFRDLAPWTVYAGNPAAELKPRPRPAGGSA